jgi:hypothetical protein
MADWTEATFSDDGAFGVVGSAETETTKVVVLVGCIFFFGRPFFFLPGDDFFFGRPVFLGDNFLFLGLRKRDSACDNAMKKRA